MKALILGGAKSGKSHYAQDLAVRLAGNGRRYYVATMLPADGEDRERIRRHLLDRDGLGFETAECPRNLSALLDQTDREAVFLVDSITALLQNAMFPPEKDYAVDEAAVRQCCESLLRFADEVENAVFVSDYIFSDAAEYDASTDAFRSCLGELHRALAARCDAVIECGSGVLTVHKGKDLL